MDLHKILDAKPQPTVVDEDHFMIDSVYQRSNHYNILTPMSDFQKELMDQIVSLHYSDILKFFERVDDAHKSLTATQERIILDSLNTMLQNAQLVASHPYLLISHYFPKSLNNRDLPKRLAETSGKFQILWDLLEILDGLYNPHDRNDRTKDRAPFVNVGIVAKEGKTLDLIDSLCTGSKCYLKRYSGVKVRDSTSKQKDHMKLHLTVHLFPSNMENLSEKELPEGLRLDYLILFDITADANKEELRPFVASGATKVLQLVPIYSVDHVALYFRHLAHSRNYNEYLKPVVAAVVAMRDRVGQIPPFLKPVYTNHLQYLTDWFENPVYTPWPLPDMPPIKTFTGKDVEHSLLTEVKFTFDNNDFLKEEQAVSGEPKELNLNFSFGGGKTQMMSHIVQPRFCGKDQNKLDFYQEKRWQKKYLTNPLNQNDYYKLTGISRTIQPNEVLTHVLIYGLTMKMAALEDVNTEARTFDDAFDAHVSDFRVMRGEYAKMAGDSGEMARNVDEKTKRIESLGEEIQQYKEKIGGLKKGIEEAVAGEIDEKRQKWMQLDVAADHHTEEIKQATSQLEAAASETKYIREEIARADKSIAESTKEIAAKQARVAELEAKILAIQQDNSGVDAARSSLADVQDEYSKAQNKKVELVDRLDLTLKQLVEVSSGRQRYVNYARGGMRR